MNAKDYGMVSGVLDARVARVVERVRAAVEGKDRLLVAIDGRCASGKTTIAAALSAMPLAGNEGCTVLHMDDFFLRPEQRTAARLAIPGGNIDHERFLTEVLTPLRGGQPFVYRPFDCHSGRLTEPVAVMPRSVCVVEGSYACHPALRDAYDLRLFSDIDPDTQMRRLIAREGEARAAVFRTRWIPLEEAYFDACHVVECCHARI